jgi:hypothetical protein
MARCEQGYLCQVCNAEVEELTDSSLYLQFVIGWVDPETLHTTPECHLLCHPELAQYVEDERFSPPVELDGPMARNQLDPEFVRKRCELITRGYRRLWEVRQADPPLSIAEYPLPECTARWH